MEEDAARLLALAQADTDWVAANLADDLNHEASLAEPPGESHHLVRGFNQRQQADWPLWDVNRALDEISNPNSEMHRLTVLWSDVQPNGPKEWRWDAYDAVVRSAAARFLAPDRADGSPNWARLPYRRTDPADIWHPFSYPDDLRAWERFVFQVARRYAAYAGAYHIWNEPNVREFWVPRQHWDNSHRVSPSGWKELYCRAARRVRLADPTAQVGLGGLGPITGQGVSWQAGRFLKRAYGVGIAACGIDFASYHPYLITPYCDGSPPMDGQLAVFRQLRRMRRVMIENGDAALSIWNTEWGFPSSTCAYTEERQADLAAQEDTYLASLPFLSHSIWFNLRDTGGPDRWAAIGVLRHDWSRKPVVFDTLADLP